MKITSNKLILACAVLLATSTFPLARAVLAHETTPTERDKNFFTVQTTQFVPGDFCGRISNYTEELKHNLLEQDSKLSEHRNGLNSKLETLKTTLDNKLASQRQDADQKRAKNYSRLLAKATTPAQKQAVNVYQQTIDQAIVERRKAVDTAIATYRSQLAQANSNNQSSVDSAVGNFKTDVKNAENQAKADCETNSDKLAVRQTFVDSLKSAQSKFRTAKDTTPKITVQIEQLTKAKNASIQTAFTTFKQTVQSATDTLKLAFKNP